MPKDGAAAATFSDLDHGEYAISAYHDKNSNGRLDTGFMGKPAEPYGFSNNARRSFGPAKYQDAKFDVREPGRTIIIHLK